MECRADLPRHDVWTLASPDRWGWDRVPPHPFGCHRSGVQTCSGPVDLIGRSQTIQQNLMELVPDPGLLPITKPTPAGHSTPTAHLLRQVLPRNPGPQDEQDPRQRATIGKRWAPSSARPRRNGREQRFNDLTQLVRNQLLCHSTSIIIGDAGSSTLGHYC